MGIPTERYSKITDKNQREICLLKAFPCAWGKCAFCDYIEDNSWDEAGMIALNNQVLNLVTGEYGVLEVINSGSCFELPKETLNQIEQVICEKNINKLFFEAHWIIETGWQRCGSVCQYRSYLRLASRPSTMIFVKVS